MWKQIRPALRNALLTVCLVGLGMLIYNVMVLRGRSTNWQPSNEYNLSFRHLFGQPKIAYDQTPSSTGDYTIRLLDDGRYERRLKNTSFMPYLVTIYMSSKAKYRLPASKLFQYADRYSISNSTYGENIDSGSSFGCGNGLGHSLIRPFEVFTDTISAAKLIRKFSPRYFVEVDSKGMLVDNLTGEVYGPATAFDRDNNDKLLDLMPNDSLTIRFYLPADKWTNFTPVRFLSNPIKVHRRELFYKRGSQL